MKIHPKYLVPRQLRDAVRPAARHFTFDHTYPRAYRKAMRPTIDEHKAVFIEYTATQLSHSMKRMWNHMQSRGFICEFVSIHIHTGTFADITRQCKLMAQMVANTRFVFICEACTPLAVLPLRPETTVVQLWHGCGAFKKFGMSTAEKIFGGTREQKLHYPAHKNTSLVTVSSPEVRWAYVEAMGLEDRPDVVQALGISRTDDFFDQDCLDVWKAQALETVPTVKGKRVLLYAPTFRGRVAEATAPDFLDLELLHERLGDDWVVLVKHHPHIRKRPPIPSTCDGFAFDVSKTLSIEAAMVVSDACVSDYSSLVFEYSLLRRPMAFLAPDIAEYDDWRGFYYDYDELTPGPVLSTTAELADWAAALEPGAYPPEIDAFRERFMSACDGHATERIADAAIELNDAER